MIMESVGGHHEAAWNIKRNDKTFSVEAVLPARPRRVNCFGIIQLI
jgi:hypothetical protein